ncbi:MAG TPA: hypothetical protein VGG64_25850 [Pirellulales bacterium]|jgi:hypothetical protein
MLRNLPQIVLPILLLVPGCGPTPPAAEPRAAAAPVTGPDTGGATITPHSPAPTGAAHTDQTLAQTTAPEGARSQPASSAKTDTAGTNLAPAVPDRSQSIVDDAQLQGAGIRKLVGSHITLYTDLPAGPDVDPLVTDFDQAYPQWCEYFGASQRGTQSWRATACLMADKQKFLKVGLLPRNLPKFLHGYFRGDRIWIYDQESDYYRRHLLLHEGTHAFMAALLGSCGPPWYKEGMAELLATHSQKNDRVTLDAFPADADDFVGWGRVRLVHEAIAAGRRLKMDDVLEYQADAHTELEPYGWCWAVAAFLDGHPRYRERFRQLATHVGAGNFNRQVLDRFANDWPQLDEEWQLFADRLEYGYDLQREAIDFRPGVPLPREGKTVRIAADRGWQSSGIELEAGRTYRLRASGSYQIAKGERPWLSDPGGVTIRYWEGRPLGVLLAAVHPEPFDSRSDSALLSPTIIGQEATLQPTATGTLYLRVNDSPAELADNAGTLEVRVSGE